MLGNVLSNILLIASPVLLATGAIRITNPMNITIDIIIAICFNYRNTSGLATPRGSVIHIGDIAQGQRPCYIPHTTQFILS